jgi:hypothetical protein
MYLNDLNSAAHNVEKINKVLANTFGHDINITEMSTNSLERMLNVTNAKISEIKESNSTYWENPQYNKLNLISHSLRTYIKEVAPGRTDGKKMKTKVKESADLEQAEVLLAAKELVDKVQKMVEDLAEMQVQELMPIVDAMKEQIGFEIADSYNAAAEAALSAMLDTAKSTKEAMENATLIASGERIAAPMPTDMGAEPEVNDELDMSDEFAGDDAAAGDDNTLGRELKAESALANMEKGALAEKKFLESKSKLFKMVESGTMSHDQFINIINELDSTGIQKMPGKMTPKIAKFLGLDRPKTSTNNVGTMRSAPAQTGTGGYDEVKPQNRRNTMTMRSAPSTPATGGYDEVKPQRRSPSNTGGYDEVKPQRRSPSTAVAMRSAPAQAGTGGYDEVKPQRRNLAVMRAK